MCLVPLSRCLRYVVKWFVPNSWWMYLQLQPPWDCLPYPFMLSCVLNLRYTYSWANKTKVYSLMYGMHTCRPTSAVTVCQLSLFLQGRIISTISEYCTCTADCLEHWLAMCNTSLKVPAWECRSYGI